MNFILITNVVFLYADIISAVTLCLTLKFSASLHGGEVRKSSKQRNAGFIYTHIWTITLGCLVKYESMHRQKSIYYLLKTGSDWNICGGPYTNKYEYSMYIIYLWIFAINGWVAISDLWHIMSFSPFMYQNTHPSHFAKNLSYKS
jgi:hypothetical protein